MGSCDNLPGRDSLSASGPRREGSRISLLSAMDGRELSDFRRCRSPVLPSTESFNRPRDEVRPPGPPAVPPEFVLPAVAAESPPSESGVLRRRFALFWPL